MAASRPHALRAERPILAIRGLTVEFARRRGPLRVVHDVDLDVWPHEIVGVIGESGSGKTMTATSTMRLLPHGAQVSGSIQLGGQELLTLEEAGMRALRGNRVAMIPQDALQSLNPTLTIGRQVGEPFVIHRESSWRKALDRAKDLLGAVHIPEPATRVGAYPHEFSGGMQQRAMIAMGLALHPDLLIADEPTTALDVTVQAEILKLLREIRDSSGAGILFITHELGVVAGLCDWVYVMHRGRVVENGSTEQIFTAPQQDYTRMLLEATPTIRKRPELPA